jgi:hypothetical protein
MTSSREPAPIRPTYPQMVAYVDKRLDSLRRVVREDHAATAELIAGIQNNLDRHMAQLGERMNTHDTWHRDQLVNQLDRGPANRANLTMAITSLLSLVIAALTIALALAH